MDIFPSFKCNFNCPFCPVVNKKDETLMDLDWLDKALSDIPGIKKFDIIGGEPSLLPVDYLAKLIDICTKYAGEKPQLYTNLRIVSPLLDRVDPVISFDFDLREDTKSVIANLLSLDVDYDINTIVTQSLIDKGPEYVLNFAKKFKRLRKLKLSSFAHFEGRPDFTPDPQQLIDFVTYLLKHDTEEKVYFYPIAAMKKQYIKGMSCEQLAEILPNGKYRLGTKDFQEVGPEFDTYKEVEQHYQEKMNGFVPEGCEGCKYLGKCINKYRDRTETCYWDYKLMETIEKELGAGK